MGCLVLLSARKWLGLISLFCACAGMLMLVNTAGILGL